VGGVRVGLRMMLLGVGVLFVRFWVVGGVVVEVGVEMMMITMLTDPIYSLPFWRT